MKKAMISILVISAAVSFAFADEGEESQPQAAARVTQRAQPQAQEPGKIIVKDVTLNTGATGLTTGKVSSVTPADLTRPKSKLSIVDAAGNVTDFTVKALGVVYDTTGNFLTLNEVKPDQEVQVNYIEKSNKTKEAAAIKILK